MDKVRAAIFSSLGDAVLGARVLDLFAGSGAMAIEALSRGAASAVLVDDDHAAVACIRRNLQKCQLQASIQTMDALRFIQLYAHPDSFDLIFADPPYVRADRDAGFLPKLLASAQLAAALARDGTLVLESAGPLPIDPPPGTPWELLKHKTYGETAVSFYTVHSCAGPD
jgi:16S rRNA (guanine966-N2)-methyltransferase